VYENPEREHRLSLCELIIIAVQNNFKRENFLKKTEIYHATSILYGTLFLLIIAIKTVTTSANAYTKIICIASSGPPLSAVARGKISRRDLLNTIIIK